VRANFPRIPIIVGDQEKPNPYLHAFYEAAGAKVVYVAADAGIGVARHAAIAEAQTEYILFCDDDFVFSNETKLDPPLQILEHDREIDIVGGAVKDLIGRIDTPFATVRRWEQFFSLDRKRRVVFTTMIDSFTPKKKEINGNPYFLADVVLNWKLVRKSAFDRGAGWDPRFKCNGEHSDFYFNIKENTDIGVAYCPNFSVYHHSPEDFSYKLKREDQDGFRKLAEKWSIDEVLDTVDKQPRMILADGWVPKPQSQTADPTWIGRDTAIPIGGAASGPLDPATWPTSQCVDKPSSLSRGLRVFFPYGGERMTVSGGSSFSLLVGIENLCGSRIGCLGERALSLSYRVKREDSSEVASKRQRATPLTQDLLPGVTFHFVNVVVDWEATAGEALELEVDLFAPQTGWLNRHSTLTLNVERRVTLVRSCETNREKVIDFRQRKLPAFLLRSNGLSEAEDWGRWSDANLSDSILLRFFEPLPRKFRLEITCMASPPNAERPVRIEIGKSVGEFSPITTMVTYDIHFVLNHDERNIKLHPPSPTSPSPQDPRRLGIGLAEIKLKPDETEGRNDTAPRVLEAPAQTDGEEVAVIDFKRRELPEFLINIEGLSYVEDWGRWSDANLSDAVTLRFFDPLPKKLRLELTCMAFGPNAGNLVLVEIGGNNRTFSPTTSTATYEIDFVLDRAERTIRIYPPSPASPQSLDPRISDDRRIGIGFVELTLVSNESATAEAIGPAATRAHPPTNRAEVTYWDGVYSQEDPWNYRDDYEQQKYVHTLELLPDTPISRALEMGCAEGHFTEMLATRVGEVFGLDISERALSRARERCRRFMNVSFECADINEYFFPGAFDLIVCSEVIYYLKTRFAVKKIAWQIAQSLSPNGHLLMTHSNSVSDDRAVTGFDFNEIGSEFIGRQFAQELAFEFLKELRTPLYRVQLFRRREVAHAEAEDPLETRRYPREVMERPVAFAHPQIKWGGCVVTFAEAKYFFDTAEVPILMYHRIASKGPHDVTPYRLDPAAFERQLSYLQRYGYSTITVDAIWRFNSSPGLCMHGKWIALTFDDGYQDFADMAWPLLKRYGFTATVFLPTDYVGGRAEWDRKYGEPAPLMDWETIRRLAKEGVSFGSHGCSHRSLTLLGPIDLAAEVERSRRILKTELGASPQGFCFPYTDFNAAVVDAVKTAGYDYAVAGSVPRDTAPNSFALPRIEIRNDDDLDRFISKLPPPVPSSKERRDEYRRMRAVRDRGTYLTIGGDTVSDEAHLGSRSTNRQTGLSSATSDDVLRLYRELLAREPESDLVVSSRVGQPVVDVAINVALSKEFVGRIRESSVSSSAAREEVIRLYGLLLGRSPESEAVICNWVGRPIVDIVADFANSREFLERRTDQTQTSADIEKLQELLLPDVPIEPGAAQEIARIANYYHVRPPTITRHMMAMNRAKVAAEKGDDFAGLGWTEPSLGKFQKNESFGDDLELVIPTVNSERWLGVFLEFYKSNEIRVVYAVDRRTSDGTRELIREYGFPLIEVQAEEERVEALLPSIGAQIAAPWILRLDDDELPTPNLLQFAAAVAAGDNIATYRFARANYRCNPLSGRLERSHFFAFGSDCGLDRQCRLYRPVCVAYHGELHTPGFLPKMETNAPDDIYILHFDWVIRSEEARQRKLESYKRQSPMAAENNKHCTLYEVVPTAWHLFSEAQDDTLQRFARCLAF
jgi:peptidoglycan/xylan/chitin deacetylase (PgdA/CDA1 family)/SAM-dependent methyltransferase/GT2 family glycosyltransferase